MRLTPIDVIDNGLRETKRGMIGEAPFVCLANHAHVAVVIGERKLRSMRLENNLRVFS